MGSQALSVMDLNHTLDLIGDLDLSIMCSSVDLGTYTKKTYV